MNCVMCDRPLLHPARTTQTKNGPLFWGRQCAIKAGLISPKPRMKRHDQAGAPDFHDPNQIPLELIP